MKKSLVNLQCGEETSDSLAHPRLSHKQQVIVTTENGGFQVTANAVLFSVARKQTKNSSTDNNLVPSW